MAWGGKIGGIGRDRTAWLVLLCLLLGVIGHPLPVFSGS